MIYMDNGATTPMREEVYRAMKPFYTMYFGNPSSVYSFAEKSKEAAEQAREQIAKGIGASAGEIYFTGGGSEADNWAVKGVVRALSAKGRHIITSKIEHHALLHTCSFLEQQGVEVTYLSVNDRGQIDLEELEQAIRPDTILISIMFANNEIGTIQPVKKIGEIAHKYGVLFHTDAVQVVGHMPVDVEALGIDLLSASAHKFYGPKGVGFLYIKRGIRLGNLIHGGAQEQGKRAGTLNVPGIVGMGRALELAVSELNQAMTKEKELRDYLIGRVVSEIPDCRLNGDPQERLPGNAHFCFSYIEGESLLLLLDQKGICGSSGSACTSGSLDPSHVLLAIGLPHEIAHGSLRLTLSAANTREEMDTVVDAVKDAVERLRYLSPLYDDRKRNQEMPVA